MGARARVKTFSDDDEEGLHNFEDHGMSTEDDEVDSDLEGGDGGDGETGKSTRDNEVDMEESGRLRLRPDIALGGEGYAGKRISRKSSFAEDEPEIDDDADLKERLRAAYSDASSSDEDEENGGIKKRILVGQDDELDALSREYEKLREEEEKGLEILRRHDEDSHLKGKGVQDQKAFWDKALEVRISLQKSVANANRLPGQEIRGLLCKEDVKVKEAYTSLTESAVKTLDCLLDLGRALIQNNSNISETFSSTPNGNGKREAEGEDRLDRAWENLDLLYSKLVPYRDNALDRWQRKTQIYSGAVGKVRFRAFNQSVSQQVAATMRDSSRLLSRMRPKRDTVHVLGQPAVNHELTKDLGTTNKAEEAEFRSSRPVEDDGDPEMFDDSEFYQQLLREFLESSDPSALGSMSLYATARQQNKKRKQVDRRASKGRKLSYKVFEPLIGFMAPKPMLLPPMTNQLFSNLFGRQKIVPTGT